MYKKSQVWPDVVDAFQIIACDHIFNTHLYPRRYTNNKADVPVRGLLNDRFDLLVPITRTANLFARFIKRREPKRHSLSGNAAQVTRIISGAFLQFRTSSYKQPALSYAFNLYVMIRSQCK